MADSILINFATRKLQEAKELSKQITRQVQETARKLKDLPRDVRQSMRQAAKNAAEVRRDEIRAMERQLNLLRTYEEKIKGRDLGFSGAVRRRATAGREALEKVRSVATAVSTGNLAAGLNLMNAVPVVGQVAAIAGAVAAIVLPVLQRELDAKIAGLEVRSQTRLDRALFEADQSRRFREDVRFRDEQLRQAVDEEMTRDARLRRGRWRRRGSYLGVGE